MNGYSNAQCDDQKSCLLELEEIFKMNAFTRDEVDHLTKLLHSRSQEVVSEIKDERLGTSKEVVQSRKDIVTSSIRQRNMIGNTHFKNFSSPSSSLKIMEDIASPVELAKAYMSSRPSKPPSSALARSQIFKGDVTPFRNPVFASTFSKTPPSLISSGNDIRDCNPMIPRFHGRSALYNMARTPYSRVRPLNISKGSSPMADSSERPSSSQNTFEQNNPSNYKQTLKRRSSVLDDDGDFPSSGPLRRTRQKQNLLIDKSVPRDIGPSVTNGANYYNDADLSFPSTSRYPLLDGTVIKDSLTQIDSRISRGSNLYSIPSQSTETAAKILQHLDKLVPSSKERMPELKITATGEGPSEILTKNSFNGNDFKIFKNEDGEKSKQVLTSAPLSHEINISMPNGDSSKVGKFEEIVENGTFVLSSPSRISMAVNSKNPVNKNISVEVTKSGIPSSSLQAQKKRSFRMSAQEDYIDLDEDINGISSSLVSVKAEPDCNGVVGSKDLPATLDLPKIQPPGKLKRPASFVFAKIPESETPKKSADFERKDGFSFQNASNQSITSSATFSGLVKPSFTLQSPLPVAAESISSLDGFANNKMEFGSSFSFSSSAAHSNLVEYPTSNHATVEAVSVDIAVLPKSDQPPKFVQLTSPPDFAPPPSENIAVESAPSLPALCSSSITPTLPPFSSTCPLTTTTTTITPFSPTPSFVNTTSTSANPFSSFSTFIPISFSSSPRVFPTTASANPFSSSSSSILIPSIAPVNPSPINSSSPPSIFSSTAGSGTNPIFSFTTSVTTTTPVSPASAFAGFSNSTSIPAPTFKFETPGSNPLAPPSSTSTRTTITEAKTAELSAPTSAGLFSSSAPSISSAPPTGISNFPLNIPNGPSAPLFGSAAAPAPSIFSFASGTPSGSSSATHCSSSSSSGDGGVFGVNPPAATPSLFGAPATKPSLFGAPAAGFSFGSGSGSFLFSSSASATATAAPGSSSLVPVGNNDQMTVEDGMAEDNMAEIVPPAPTPTLFSQPPPAPSFIFGGTPPPAAVGGSVFQFGGGGTSVGQTATPSPFSQSGNVGFGGGGDFSMGSGGGGVDKSNRKFIKVKHRNQRRK